MPEVPDRIPGDLIVASYSNTLRDRVLQRYVDQTERAVLNPVPGIGELSWVDSDLQMSVWDGTAWKVFAGGQEALDVLNRLVALENQLVFTPLQGTKVTVQSDSANVIRNVTISQSPPTGGADGDIWMQY